MDQGLIPKRYAKALFEVAKEKGRQEKLYQQMQLLCHAFDSEPSLGQTMRNPFVSNSDKASLIMNAAQAGDSDQMLADFITLLERNGRVDMIRDIANAYTQIFRRANNIYRVQVTAAAPMGADQEERLKKMILDHLNGGTMEYSYSVDPDLIGGFVVDIDNERLDASVKNELKQLRLNLLSNK